MVQSPSLEANRFSASQEIPRIPWNPKVKSLYIDHCVIFAITKNPDLFIFVRRCQ
jgi:hypothetical protein